MVFEHGDDRHAEVYVLAGRPAGLSGDGDLDSVFGEESDGRFFANEPGEAERVDLVEVEEADEVGGEPDGDSGPEVGPGCEVVVAMPKEHAGVNDGDGDVGDDENFVGVGAEEGEGVEAEYYQRNKGRNACTVDVDLPVEERFQFVGRLAIS